MLGGSAVAGWVGCAQPESPRQGLVRLLGLNSNEIAWLDVLSDDEQRELHERLSDSQGNTRTIQLVARVLGPRSRVFAFLGYPALANRRSVCDGTVRE